MSPNVMPAGSQPPKEDVTPTPGDNGTPKEDKLILGKFKTSEDLANSYTDLERKLGEQGAQNKQLTDLLVQKGTEKAPAKPAEPEGPGYEDQLAEIQRGVEDGKLSVAEGIVKSSNLAAEHATTQAMQRSEKMQADREIQSEQKAFLKEHPDFDELKKTGALEKVKGNMPHLHDDFSAYFHFKANESIALADEARKQGEVKGKEEAARIADGDRRTKKVLQKPGTSAADVGRQTGRMSKADIKQSMRDRLSKLNE